MTITTNYNIGDVIYTVDTDTLKIINAPITRVSVGATQDMQLTVIYTIEIDGNFKCIEQSKCFASAEELMRHLSQK
jgi:hypothetical protein